MALLLFVTRRDSIHKQRYIARDDVSWRDSLTAIADGSSVNDFKIEFPTESEFFGAHHTAQVAVLS